MFSRAESRCAGPAARGMAVLLLALCLGPPAALAQEDVPPAGATATSLEVAREAVKQLRDNEDLKDSEIQRVPEWQGLKAPKTKAKDPSEMQGFWRWLLDASEWVAGAARWTLWLLLAIAVVAAIVTARRWMRLTAPLSADAAGALPERVGSLDVRPQSLPERIGEAALALWRQGRVREALSLLYRGALSRLIHQHAVPIRAAHTEEECLRHARARVPADIAEYFAEIVRAWQLAVFAGRAPGEEVMPSLCGRFDPMLTVAADSGAGSAAASAGTSAGAGRAA